MGGAFRVAMATACLFLSGCVGMESVAPPLRDSARDYSEALDEFTDREIILNVLRARDGLPLNFADISSIIGSVSFSGSTSAAIPFGALHASTTRNSFTPSLSFSSSPTFNIVPLNTSGFTINIVQPIPPTYVLSKWKSGVDRDFLLKLFIKRISVGDREYFNQPGEPTEAEFDRIISTWATKGMMKSVSVMEPLGSPVAQGDLQQALSGVAGAPLPEDGQLYAGVEYALTPGTAPKLYPVYQLYRRFPGQVIICANEGEVMPPTLTLYTPIPEKLPTATASELSEHVKAALGKNQKNAKSKKDKDDAAKAINDFSQITPTFELFGKGSSSPAAAPPTTPAATAPKSGSQPGSKDTKGSGPAALATSVSSITQSGRISDFVELKLCRADQLVLAQQSEEQFSKASEKYVHIEWRSVAEVIQYLGLVIRQEERGGDVAPLTRKMFELAPVNEGREEAVHYRDKFYLAGTHGYTGQSLTLISELLNASKISQDIPITSQLQVVP